MSQRPRGREAILAVGIVLKFPEVADGMADRQR
jgi:hypothetical protein